MKDALRKLCRPVLVYFEKGEPAASYRGSHRIILLAAATLFLILSCVSLYFALSAGQPADDSGYGIFCGQCGQPDCGDTWQ